jgi:hypothetical protein
MNNGSWSDNSHTGPYGPYTTGDTIFIPNSTGTGGTGYPHYPQPVPTPAAPTDNITIDPGSTWTFPDDYEMPGDEELAKKMLHDPEFDVGEVILEMVKDWIRKKRSELEDHPVAKKYLPESKCFATIGTSLL